MRRVPRWITPRWRTATALTALALGVSAFGAFALPWFQADVPRPDSNAILVAEADASLDDVVEERRCRFHSQRNPADL